MPWVFWKPPILWDKATAFIIGGGPSVLGADYCLPWEHREALFTAGKVIGVNDGYKVDRRIPICFFGDGCWFEWNHQDLNHWPGIVITSADKFAKQKNRVPYLKVIPRGKPNGIETKRSRIAFNRSSGPAAINLAYHLGATRIVLIGFDMRIVDGQKNFHNHHKSTAKDQGTGYKTNKKDPKALPRFLEPFNAIAHDAKTLKLEIINSTPDSALKHFLYMPLKEAIEKYVMVNPS